MASSSKQQCRVCGGESFTTTHGLKVCDQCGRQEEHYIELLSQETVGEVDRSRLIKTRMHNPDGEDVAPPPHEKEPNNWTTFEAYNCVLYEWTKAMVKLGASPKFGPVVFKLWVAYLQRRKIAFMPVKRKYVRTSLKNTRDVKLIHEGVESVCSSSLHSYRLRKKKRKKKPTKLDKIKDKIEWRKRQDEMRKKKDSSFMNKTLANELSKSLNEFEASMLSDSGTSLSSSCGSGSRTKTSGKSEPSSCKDGSSHLSSYGKGSDTEREPPPCLRKKQIRRDKVIRNWIKETAKIYRSDSEEDLQQEEEKEVEKEETGEGKRSRETDDTEEAEHQDSGVKAKRICGPKRRIVSSKRPRKTLEVKKRENKKHMRKAEKASERVIRHRTSTLPFVMSFSKLLALLYLAVLLAEEDILLSDIIRWCREGHIPYYSAPYLLRPNMEVGYYDLAMFKNCKNLPNAKEVQTMAGRLAVYLSLQYVPLPAMGGILKKFVKVLNLPEEVTNIAEKLARLVEDRKYHTLAVPPVESLAMASIIMALKMFCGLDNHTEVILSQAVDVVKTELPDYTIITPFSWQDWQKYISRLLWVCCNVDPSAAFHWQPLHKVCHFSPEVFSKYFWSEGMWRIPRTSRKKKAELQLLVEELLEQQGLKLEEVVMQPPLFNPSRQPLCSTIEQLLQRDCATASKETLRYIQVAEELKKESFAKHTLYWVDDIDHISSELHKCDSKTILYLTKRMGTVNLTNVEDPNVVQPKEDQARNENVQNTLQVLFVPHPLTHYWKLNLKKYSTWEKVSPGLPSTFKWLVCVGSNLCEAPKMQILSLLGLMQIKIKAKKCS